MINNRTDLSVEKLTHREFAEWDAFVRSHPLGWITHLSQWKQIIEEAFSHLKGDILILRSQRSIVAGLPIYQAKSWLFGSKLISIPFATISDPLVSNAEQAKLLLEKALEIATQNKIDILEIRTCNSGKFLEKTGLTFSLDDNYKQHILHLNRDSEDLLKSFNKRNVRKRIRQAKEKQITARFSNSNKDLAAFYNFYLKTRKRLGLPPQPFQFLLNLRDRFQDQDIFHLVLAEQNGKILGGLVFFTFQQHTSAEIIAYDENFRNLHVSQFLYWQAISYAKENNCQIFDFGRTSIHNQGVMTFKNHWTSELKDLPIYYFSPKIRASAKAREKSVVYSIIRSIGKVLPDSLFRFYGKIFYHHST